jgi:hypothetical protein
VTFGNIGLDPIGFGSASIQGDQYFSVVNDGCSGTTVNRDATCVIQVGFAAQQAGTYRANLVVVHSAGTEYVPVQGTTLMVSGGVNPPTTDLGIVAAGTTALAIITVSSEGNLPLVITGDSLASTSTFFSIRSDGCAGVTLAPGSTCSIVVAFSPLDPGRFSATLTVADNNEGPNPQSATITGAGSTGRASFSPANVDFGRVKVGRNSAAQTLTVTNVGNAPLQIGTVAITGPNATDFSIVSNNCASSTLATGATCTVTLRSRPSGIGLRTAQLTMSADDPRAPYAVQLTVTGAHGQ